MGDLDGIYQAMAEYQFVPDKDPYASMNLQGFATNTSIVLVLSMVYLKPEESPAALSSFSKLTPVLDTAQIQILTEYMGGHPVPELKR